jgi:hypothetical protein
MLDVASGDPDLRDACAPDGAAEVIEREIVDRPGKLALNLVGSELGQLPPEEIAERGDFRAGQAQLEIHLALGAELALERDLQAPQSELEGHRYGSSLWRRVAIEPSFPASVTGCPSNAPAPDRATSSVAESACPTSRSIRTVSLRPLATSCQVT